MGEREEECELVKEKFLVGLGAGIGASIVLGVSIYGMGMWNSRHQDGVTKVSESVEYDKSKIGILERVIEQHYMGESDEQEFIEGIYKGYVYGLEDPYTMYLTAEEFAKETAEDKGNYIGVGIKFSWGMGSQHLIVTEVIPGSPADQAGIVVGDKIVEIDGIRAMASNEVQIYEKLVYAGTDAIKYIITDNKGMNERELSLVPYEIEVDLVKYELLNSDIGYIALDGFVEGTTEEVSSAMDDLKVQGATSFVLDLRDTNSNAIEEVQKLTDLFIDEQTVFSVEYKQGHTVPYTSDAAHYTEELVVITNSYTSGAIEAFVAAVNDFERGMIVGQETAGHGTIQEKVALDDGSGLNIATGIVLTSKQEPIRENGIPVDIEQRTHVDNTLELITTGTLDKEHDSVLQKAIECLQ